MPPVSQTAVAVWCLVGLPFGLSIGMGYTIEEHSRLADIISVFSVTWLNTVFWPVPAYRWITETRCDGFK
jgi:hypothetical protein